MTITPDTIGPDFPAPSTDGWHPHAGLASRDDLDRALGQARKDGAEMRSQRDWWKGVAERALESSERLEAEVDRLRGWAESRQRIIDAQLQQIAELEAALVEANQRAALNEQACLDLLGQIEDRNTQTAAQLRIAATALGHLEEMHR